MQFDFLGKDSIKYENTVEVELPVYNAILKFQKGGKLVLLSYIVYETEARLLSIFFSLLSDKQPGDDLFDKLDTSILNAHLKELMPNLTAKVFRTFNASFTLDDMVKNALKLIPRHSHCHQKEIILFSTVLLCTLD
jgi:DNA topoisomerase-1